MWSMYYAIMRSINQMSIHHIDRQGWLVIFVIALVVGAICLRGFGSRTSY